MKKSVLVLLISLLVAGMSFAQATVNGYVRAIGTYSETDFAYADRARLNLSFLSEDKNVQFFTRLQASTAIPNTPLLVPYAWGSIKTFGGMVKFTGGLLGNYDYQLSSYGISDYFGGSGKVQNEDNALDGKVQGMLVQLYPVAGLDIGVLIDPKSAVETIGMKNFGLNAKYEIAKVGTVIAESQLGTEMTNSRYSASFNFTGVKDLSVAAGYKHSAADVASVFGLVKYSMGAISCLVAPEFYLSSSALYVEGWVRYTMGDYAFTVLGAYDKDLKKLIGGATALDTYMFGLEAYYNVSKNAQLMAGVTYAEFKKLSVPLLVKVIF